MAKLDRTIYIILALVVISWGLNIVMVKYLTSFMSPMLVAAIRIMLAGVVLLPFVWYKHGLYKPTLKEWGLLFLVAVSSLFFHQLFLAYGVVTTTATNASIILGLNPLTTAMLAALFIGEKFNMKLGIGILLGFSGVLLVVASNSMSSSIGFSGWGDILMFLAMLTYVIGGLIIKKMTASTMPTLVMTAYSTVIGGILLNMAALVVLGPSSYQQIQLPAIAWVTLLLSAWGATALGALGWNHGIKYLGANRTAMFVNGMPFVSMLGGVIFLNERIGWIHVVALLLTTAGIVIGTRKSFRKSKDLIEV